MDIQKAFRASPLLPAHKCYVPISWWGNIYIDHVVPFGLSTACGIQGIIADATVDIVAAHGYGPTHKWVDDFSLFREPSDQGHISITVDDQTFHYSYDLKDILHCTALLGIPWHDVATKGHDFQFNLTYVGFSWDLWKRTVALPEQKHLRYLRQIASFMMSRKTQLEPATRLHGTLQHITFVYVLGRSYLPALTRLISKFDGNRFAYRYVDRAVTRDLDWWCTTLACTNFLRSLLPRTTIDLNIWADASTSWGVGLWINAQWAVWRLQLNWSKNGRDIGWLEIVAIELAALWLSTQNIYDSHIRINSDNTGVISALNKGRSRNPQCNKSIKRISMTLAPFNISLDPCYVASADNKADSISRSEMGLPEDRLNIAFELPSELKPFFVYD